MTVDQDPTLRAADPLPESPSNIAEAVEQLEAELDHPGSTDLRVAIAGLLALIDAASEEIAAHERDRWRAALRKAARRGSALSQETRAGLHIAASMIERNRETST